MFQIKGQQAQGDEEACIPHQKLHIAQSSQQMPCDKEGVTKESRELHRNQVTESLRGPITEFRFYSQGNEGHEKPREGS